MLWDIFKSEIRDETIIFCKQVATERKNQIHLLENNLKKLSESKNSDNKQKEIEIIEENLEKLYISKTKGAQIRSRVKWIEEGEKIQNFF